MKPMRVLVVDDSAYNRRTISDMLCALPGVEVVGKAGDGDEALRLASELLPDLITLDLEMPRMDGFTFLRLLMARRPTPVVVVSGYSAKENVFRALELGAIDFIAKPSRTVASDLSSINEALSNMVQVIRQLAPPGLDPARRVAPVRSNETPAISRPEARAEGAEPKKVVLIGSSTGGPTALIEVFRRISSLQSSSVVVAQHMPERFTKTFADRLDRIGGLRVFEASGVHRLEPGVAWICPGGKCIEIAHERGQGLVVKVVRPDANDRYLPSVDRLFASAAGVAGSKLIAAVLTGMGDDGAKGVLAVKNAGGVILAESPETAVIYGMPGAAVRTGAVDHHLPLRTLGDKLAELAT
jgi:two-component system chemotaxis response regulator CheB